MCPLRAFGDVGEPEQLVSRMLPEPVFVIRSRFSILTGAARQLNG